MDFDYYTQLNKFITDCPFIYTANNDYSDSDYLDYFILAKKCRHNHRLPFAVNPYPLVTDLRKNIFQTYAKATPQGGLATLTLIQLNANEHLSLVYTEQDSQFVASVGMYLSDAQRIPALQGELAKYKIQQDKKKVAGFAAAIGHN